MNKSLLALALVGAFAGSASAQTNVTVYGVVDAGVNRVDDGVNATTGIDSGLQSGSRLGFRGSEDLGGGLSAIFTLESGFNIDDGRQGQGGRLFGRQAFVGLTNPSWGTLSLGRQYAPIRKAVEAVDPFGLGLAGTASRVFNLYGERIDNSINYASPEFGGFSGQLMYGFGEQAGSNSLGRNIGASASYVNGPILVQFAYHDQNLLTAANADNGSADTVMLGGSYDFGVAKLHLAYAQNDGETVAGVANVDSNDMLVGASAKFGPGTVLATYIRHADDLVANGDSNLWALGYTYAMSKRTNLYTSYGQIRNDPGASLGGAAAAGEDPTQFNIGVRHRF